MTDWSQVGGSDPAPGDVSSLTSIGSQLTSVASRVGDVRQSVSKAHVDAGLIGWTGPAADSYRDRVKNLPSDLGKAENSFQLAGAAVANFATSLQNLQARAVSAANRAVDAANRQAAAQSSLNQVRNQIGQVQADLTTVRFNLIKLAGWRQAAYIAHDSGRVAACLKQESQQRGIQARLNSELSNLHSEQQTFQGRVDAAGQDLANARGAADSVRRDLDDARNSLKSALHRAHDAGLNESTRAKLHREFEDWGGALKTALDELSLACTVLAFIPTPLSPFLFGAGRVLAVSGAVLGIALETDKFLTGGYGFDAEGKARFGADLLGDALGLVPGGKAGTRVAKYVLGGKVVGDATEIGFDVYDISQDKPGATMQLIQHGISLGTDVGVPGKATKWLISEAHKDPGIAKQLDSIAKRVGDSQAPPKTRNATVSVLEYGNQKGGQFSYGYKAPDHPQTRILSHTNTDQVFDTINGTEGDVAKRTVGVIVGDAPPGAATDGATATVHLTGDEGDVDVSIPVGSP